MSANLFPEEATDLNKSDRLCPRCHLVLPLSGKCGECDE